LEISMTRHFLIALLIVARALLAHGFGETFQLFLDFWFAPNLPRLVSIATGLAFGVILVETLWHRRSGGR
jgi:hypothetical protein